MKKIKTLHVLFAVLFGTLTFALASCDTDSDDSRTPAFFCNPSIVRAAIGEKINVTLTGGKEAYTATSSDEKTATVSVAKSTLTVTGVKVGRTAILIADAEKKMVSLPVIVTEKATELHFDHTALSLAAGAQATVTVNNGEAPYAVTTKNAKTAEATVADNKITVKGVKAGKTTITVTDKNKLTGTITVQVK